MILAAVLEGNQSVQWVSVSGNQLGAEGGKAIADALQTNVVLQSIEIGSEDNPAIIPIKQLRDNSVDVLDYSGKKMLSEGGIVLAAALTVTQNMSVTTVHVSQNSLGPEGGKALASALQTNPSITTVEVKS